MMRWLGPALTALALAVPIASSADGGRGRLVFCAPGYPGSTAEAQPAMDAFAAALAGGRIEAVYFASEKEGVEAVRAADSRFAVVSFPFFIAHRESLRLTPRLQAVPRGGQSTETWSLVARKGRVTSPADLEGWEIVGPAAFAPGFVRDHVIAGWGNLPANVLWRPTAAVLSALKRAASGESIAVLLDGAGSLGLASLPFAGELETVVRSAPVPVAVFCSIAGRAPDAEAQALTRSLQVLHERPEGAAALEGLRLDRFVPVAPQSPPRAAPQDR